MIKIALAICIATLTYAAPAVTGDIEFEQKDGSTFQAQLKGDEWFNWIEDKKDNIIIYNKQSKNYEYAQLTESNGETYLIPSGKKVDVSKNNPTNINKDTLAQIWKQKKEKASNFPHVDEHCK